ncbi:MAG: dimethyl sulfoxide reductase anchor subunit [Anaerolineales bacterium]|nr:dimethyl sulfoxide reductase anchor subunit [Anaerolineales bacterium]MBK8824571.1 dimethyl sulfoxide reductase anchor subunit [Anaerolineales bacterium]
MDTREWALLIFTILGQIAAGSLLVLLIVRAFAVRMAGVDQADRFTNGPLYIIFPIMGLALLSSLLHLGNPLNIAKAVPNLGTSWLSREVVIAVVFVILVGVYALMQWRKIGNNVLRTVIGWITGLLGLVQVYGMGMVYMIRTQPAWNTLATPVSFLVTALLLGVATIAAALIVNNALLNKGDKKDEQQLEMLRKALQGLAIASIALLGVEFLVTPLYMAYLPSQGVEAMQSLEMMVGTFGVIFALRLIFVFVGAGILATYIYRNASILGKEGTLSTLVFSALILILTGEVMGRFIFYATHVRIGL